MVIIQAAVACAAAVGAKLLHSSHKHNKAELDEVLAKLHAVEAELEDARRRLGATSVELKATMHQLERSKGELGTRTSENQLIKSSFDTVQRQLAQAQVELQNANMRLRYSDEGATWDD